MWKAPAVSQMHHRIAVAPVAGKSQSAQLLTNKLMEHAPQKLAVIVGPEELDQRSLLRLASFDGQPNEFAALKAALHSECSVLLVGEVIQDQLADQDPGPKRFFFFQPKPPPKSLTVAWRAVDSQSGKVLATKLKRFEASDLKIKSLPSLSALDETDRILSAAAEEAWSMVLPTLERIDAPLAAPTLGPDVFLVFQGNQLAKQGLWDQAEMKWQDAASRYPKSKSAWHNLSIASIAKEDFTQASERIRHADWWYPYAQAKRTMVWLEHRQRAYHRAFNLPDPKDGWRFPDLPDSPP